MSRLAFAFIVVVAAAAGSLNSSSFAAPAVGVATEVMTATEAAVALESQGGIGLVQSIFQSQGGAAALNGVISSALIAAGQRGENLEAVRKGLISVFRGRQANSPTVQKVVALIGSSAKHGATQVFKADRAVAPQAVAIGGTRQDQCARAAKSVVNRIAERGEIDPVLARRYNQLPSSSIGCGISPGAEGHCFLGFGPEDIKLAVEETVAGENARISEGSKGMIEAAGDVNARARNVTQPQGRAAVGVLSNPALCGVHGPDFWSATQEYFGPNLPTFADAGVDVSQN